MNRLVLIGNVGSTPELKTTGSGIAVTKAMMKLKKTRWTEDEKNYLAEHYGEMSIKSLARNLSRSENAINVMRYKLRLGRFLENGDYVTLNQLHEAIYGRSLNTYINGTWGRAGLGGGQAHT